MKPVPAEGRAHHIVTGVVAELLRSTGASGVVVSGDGPEAALLTRWLETVGIRVEGPSQEAVVLGLELLMAAAADGTEGRRRPAVSPVGLAARAMAEREKLLLLGTSTKTMLLLSPSPPWEPILPLGDLFASEVLDLEGECTVPCALGEVRPPELRAVEEGLQRYFEENLELDDALASVEEPLRKKVALALAQAGRGWHPRPLVPKIRGCTLGIDLDL